VELKGTLQERSFYALENISGIPKLPKERGKSIVNGERF